MVSDTENRKAADWLPEDLLSIEDREDLLANVNPALLLSGDGRLPLWASDAAARALGFRNADVFMRRRLAEAAPGAQRLTELAATLEVGEAPRLERLRFYVGFRRVSITASCQVIHLVNGSRALLVSFPAEADEYEEEMIPAQSQLLQPAPVERDRTDLRDKNEDDAGLEQAIGGYSASSSGEENLGEPDQSGAELQIEADLQTEADLLHSPSSDVATFLPEDASPAPPPAHSPLPLWVSMPITSRRMQRFVFTLDADGTILSISPALSEAVGEAQAFKVGDNLVEVITALDEHAGLHIERAIAAREIWSDIKIDWPVAGSTLKLPITLAALPNLSTAQNGGQGLGFSGFGRLHFDQAQEQQAEVEHDEHAIQNPLQDSFQDSSLQKSEDEKDDLIELPSLFLSDNFGEEAEDEAIPEDALPLSGMRGASDLTDEEEGLAAPITTEPNLPEDEAQWKRDEAAPSPPQGNTSDHPISNVTQLPPRPIKPGEQAANVVTLRAGQTPHTNGTTPQQGGLSLSERHAFREIAKALGARFDGETPVDSQQIRAAVRGYTAQRQRPTPQSEGDHPSTPSENNAAFWPDPALPANFAQNSESKITALLDKLPIGLLVLKGDEALFANRTLLDLTGYVDFATFLAEKGVDAIFRKSSQPRKSNAGFDTIVLATREGEMIPVDAHLQVIDWQGNHATMMSLRRASELEQGKALRSVAVDLRRARAEANELRNILDTATDGVLTLDEDGKILSLNSAAEALFGLSQNEVVGETFLQLLMNESHADALDYLEGMKANGVKSVLNDGREVQGRERKGGLIPLFMTLGQISEEEPRRFCAVLRDLTAWKRAETQLQEAKRAAESASAKKSDFLTRISHEIRTPINAIIGFAEVMEEERLGPINNPRYKEYLGDIRVSGHHVVSLVNDLLDLAKIEAGRLELSFAATDINAIVTGCIALMQPQANSARVLVRSQIASKLPKVVADERSVRQIVLNMLSNATRYTQSGGQVIVSTAMLDNGEAVIRIRDTGVGMSKAEIEKALEPFQQVGSSQKSGGTGLGLPLTKALVEANRAHFSIRSTPGEGTLVEICFPATRVLAE